MPRLPLYRLPSYLADLPHFGPGRLPMVVTIETIGIPNNIRGLKKWNRNMERAAERGVKKATKFLLKETLKVTPKKTGILRDSGKTEFRGKGKNIEGIVYFDETEAPYAIYVHEDLEAYHKPPTTAKFLQKTQYEKRGEISRIIREECARARPT